MNVKKMINILLAVFWPEICPFCMHVCREGVCRKCRKELERIRIREPRCMKCGKPVRYAEQEYCYDCIHGSHVFDQGYSLWIHRLPVNRSIYQFKYHNQRHFAVLYAEEISQAFMSDVLRWRPDLIMPIPLHKKRKRKRGYNQALLLANELGRILGIPVDSYNLVRKIYTDPQKKLNPEERKHNIRKAFAVRNSFRSVDTVLLVDDIYTTGNTLDAAAGILKARGVQKVFFLTISIGQGY